MHPRVPHVSGRQVADAGRLYHSSGWRRRWKWRWCRSRAVYAERSPAQGVSRDVRRRRMSSSVRVLSPHRLLVLSVPLLKVRHFDFERYGYREAVADILTR